MLMAVEVFLNPKLAAKRHKTDAIKQAAEAYVHMSVCIFIAAAAVVLATAGGNGAPRTIGVAWR